METVNMFDVVIAGATVVTPHRACRANVGVVGEKIAAIEFAPIAGKTVVDGSGKWLIPGVIDTHLHLQPELRDDEQGGGLAPWADGYDAGTVAAAFGGVTSVLDMRIQERGKGATAVAAVVRGREDASRKAVIDFSFHAGLTNPSMETLAEIPELVAMGIPSFKFFLTYPNWHIRVDLGFLYEAFRVVRANNGIAAVHCEDDQIIEHLKQKYVSAGREDLYCYALARPDFAEEIAISNVGILARETGAQAYAVHVSSRKGLEAAKHARNQGAQLYLEGVPHYLTFTEDVLKLDPVRAAQFVMGPPYRTDEDIAALWEGIRDGSIDWMGSDHSPYLTSQKTRDMRFHADPAGTPNGVECAIPTGIGGTEILLPLMLSEGVNRGRISIERLVELMSCTPAKRLGLRDKGAIRVGLDADLVLVDPTMKKVVRNDDLHSNGDFSLYEGIELTGWPVMTMSRGKIIVRDRVLHGRPGDGRLLKRELP